MILPLLHGGKLHIVSVLALHVLFQVAGKGYASPLKGKLPKRKQLILQIVKAERVRIICVHIGAGGPVVVPGSRFFQLPEESDTYHML